MTMCSLCGYRWAVTERMVPSIVDALFKQTVMIEIFNF